MSGFPAGEFTRMSSNILCNKGYKIPLSDLSYKQLKKVMNELTVKPNNMMVDKDDDSGSFKLYKVNDKYIIVPKFYGIENFGYPEVVKYDPAKSKMKFKSELRDYQVPVVNDCIDRLRDTQTFLLNLCCGWGKTIAAIYIACKLGYKTLIIVHKSFLLQQWIERIKQVTNAKIGIIQGKTIDVKDKDIVIGMVQSISKKNYDSDIFKEFGFVIYDEVHHMASQHFSKTFSKTCAKYTLGLSATIYRLDGLTKVLFWHLGKNMIRIKMKENDQVIVKIINFNSSDKDYKPRERYIMGKMRPDCIKMETYLTENIHRNNNIIEIINELRKNTDRKILILSKRKKHLKILKTGVDKLIKKDIDDEEIDKNECITHYYTGDLNEKERDEAEKNGDLLFATFGIAAEGLDISKINCVILASPVSSATEQSIGRGIRKILQDDDERPLIVDFKDNISIYQNQGEKREKIYKRGKYCIENYFVNDDELMDQKEYCKKTKLPFNKKINTEFMDDMEEVMKTTLVKLPKNYLLTKLKIENIVGDCDGNGGSDNEDNFFKKKENTFVENKKKKCLVNLADLRKRKD